MYNMWFTVLFVPLVLAAQYPYDLTNDIFVQPMDCFEDEPPIPSANLWVIDNIDDHVEIQKAIDTLASRGAGALRLMPCVYNLGKRIEMRNNVNVYGEDDEQMVYQTTLDFSGNFKSDSLVLFNNVSNIEMIMVNIRKTDVPNHVYAIKVKSSKNIALYNMRVNTNQIGVRIDGASVVSTSCVHVSNAAVAMDIRNSKYVNIGCKDCSCVETSFSGGLVENAFANNTVLYRLSNNHYTNVYSAGYNLGQNNTVFSQQL